MFIFLFTDIQGSTRLWEEHTGEMGEVIARHDAILQKQVEAFGGRITKHTGDGITAAFEGGQPLTCALEVQKAFAAQAWGEVGDLRIRVGIHAGDAEFHASAGTPDGDYFGPSVNATARVMSAAWGGQILLTPEVTEASPLPEGATLLDLGEHLLKDVSAPQQLYQLVYPQLSRGEFPPPRTLSGQSIRQAVDERGEQMAGLEPEAMGSALVAVTLLPALQGELDPDSGALEGNLGVLEDLDAVTLSGFVVSFVERLRAGEPLPGSEIEVLLQRELQVAWQAGDESAFAIRTDASRLLQAVHGVEAAMMAASENVKEALALRLADLGGQFGEFRWILAGVQDTLSAIRTRQELQLSLQREQLAKTEQILQHQREKARLSVAALSPVAAEPPAFLEDDEKPYEGAVFVARERELARLEGYLDDAQQGSGRVVFVTGGPGRGKTALLNEFARRAMEAHPGLLVASGNCNAFSGIGDPYLPFREVMGMLSGDVEARWTSGVITQQHARSLWAAMPTVVQALLGHGPHILGVLVEGNALLARAVTAAAGDAPWLGSLQETVGRQQTTADGPISAGVEQSHLFEQYSNVLRKVSESHPLLLILDDVQWADTASIGLLFHLSRRLEGLSILIVCAYRPEEVALGRAGEHHPLEKVLAEMKRRFGNVWVELGQEDEAEDRRFVDALLDTEPNELGEAFRGALHIHTGGHPLFAIELLRDMQERGDLVQNKLDRWVEGPALSWESLPARVEGVIEVRIGRLEEELREALAVASVEGEEFTAQVVAQVQAVQERRLLRQLTQELEKRHRLIRERGEDRSGHRLLSRYRFVHHLFQRYLYNSLSAGERRLLHGEIAEVLEELFADSTGEIAVQLAFHYRRAELEDRALPYVIQAGHQSRAKYANEEAIGYYTEALQMIPEVGPSRLDLLAARAAVYELVAKRDEQKADVEEMVASARTLDDQPRLCDALVALSDYYEDMGLHEALDPAKEALEIAERLGDPLRQAYALRRLGALNWFRGDFHQSREQLEAAIKIFEDTGLIGEEARCWHMLALALGRLNQTDLSLEAAERSVALSQESGDRRQEAIGLRRIAIALSNQSRNAKTVPFARRALDLHREVGDRAEESAALNVIGGSLVWLGEYGESERYVQESLDIAESIGSSVNIRFAALHMVQYHYWRRGDFQEGLVFLAVRIEKALVWEDDWLVAMLQFLEGISLYHFGQHEAAQEVLETSVQTMAEVGSPADQLQASIALGIAQALAGEPQRGMENLRFAAEKARETRDETNLSFVLINQGLCALLEGKRETMEWGLERIQKFLDLGREIDPENICTSYGIMAGLHLALGEVNDALECSSEGLQLLETLPSPWWPERAFFTHAQILRALGHDQQADDYLKRAYDRVKLVASKTQDEGMKSNWLEKVQVNRDILVAAAERGLSE